MLKSKSASCPCVCSFVIVGWLVGFFVLVCLFVCFVLVFPFPFSVKFVEGEVMI